MKVYLVACNLGAKVKAYKVEMPDGYVPASDDMKTLKEAIAKQHAPRYVSSHAAPDSCGGYISNTESNETIRPDDISILSILAVSRLDL